MKIPLMGDEFFHAGEQTNVWTNKEYGVLHVQSNTTIFQLVVQ